MKLNYYKSVILGVSLLAASSAIHAGYDDEMDLEGENCNNKTNMHPKGEVGVNRNDTPAPISDTEKYKYVPEGVFYFIHEINQNISKIQETFKGDPSLNCAVSTFGVLSFFNSNAILKAIGTTAPEVECNLFLQDFDKEQEHNLQVKERLIEEYKNFPLTELEYRELPLEFKQGEKPRNWSWNDDVAVRRYYQYNLDKGRKFMALKEKLAENNRVRELLKQIKAATDGVFKKQLNFLLLWLKANNYDITLIKNKDADGTIVKFTAEVSGQGTSIILLNRNEGDSTSRNKVTIVFKNRNIQV